MPSGRSRDGRSVSAEIVNLRRFRKTTARADREAGAAVARTRHGRSKGERAAQALETGRATRLLDGARRDTSPAPTLKPADGG